MEKREYRIGICDDDVEDIKRIEAALQLALRKTGQPVRLRCRSFRSGEEMYAATRREKYNLLFLDIEMPGMDGFELAAKLSMDRQQIGLIFVSVHESFVFDAPEYSPLWFVRKSCLERDMFRALRKYLQDMAYMNVRYRLKEGYGFRDLFIMDILFIECSGHELTIQKTDGGCLKKYGSLKVMEKELEGCHFLRIHKNYLVNQAYIREVGNREVYLTNGDVLEMGRDRKNEIRNAMRQYEQEKHGN